MSCGNLRDSLLKASDCILGVREQIGAQVADVYLIERTWAGQRPGDGTFVDVSARLSPTPQIVDYSHDVRLSEAGSYKSGDLILRGISRNVWAEAQLLTVTDAKNKEKFYKIGSNFYTAIHIKENFLTWDVHVRKLNEDETERG
jgi:hypothetical protein